MSLRAKRGNLGGGVFLGIASGLTPLANTKSDVIASPSLEGRGNLGGGVGGTHGDCFVSKLLTTKKGEDK